MANKANAVNKVHVVNKVRSNRKLIIRDLHKEHSDRTSNFVDANVNFI
jgi:hypothetical protein